MAVGDKQRLIAEIVGIVLGEKAQEKSFLWLKSKHRKDDFQVYYPIIDKIFLNLNGNKDKLDSKKEKRLTPDCYFGGKYNFIFEFDELQHFTSYKKIALMTYPKDLLYGFNIEEYLFWCDKYCDKALKKGPAGYRKEIVDFPFKNGRAAQRAYLDAFRDFLPTLHGLNKTIRICEFEVDGIDSINHFSIDKVEKILTKKI